MHVIVVERFDLTTDAFQHFFLVYAEQGPDVNATDSFSIYSASHGPLKSINLALPHGSVAAISGIGPVGKTTLVRGIVGGYSEWLLHQVQSRDRFSGPVPLVEGAEGVLPTKLVDDVFERLPKSVSVGEFLGLSTLLEIASARIARPSCELPGCKMEDRSVEKSLPEIMETVAHGGLERPIVALGARLSIEKSKILEALQHYNAEGYRRFLLNGRLFRSADGTPEIPAVSEIELCVLSETLSPADATPLRLAEAVKASRALGDGIVIVLVAAASAFRFDGSPLDSNVRQWTIFDGFGCERCDKRFFRSAPVADFISLKVADQRIDQLSSLTVARIRSLMTAEAKRLGAATPTVVQLLLARLEALEELSLADLSPEDRLGDLPHASRYLCALAKSAPAGALHILDCPERILGADAVRCLAPYLQRRLAEGDSVLLATDSSELRALASHHFELSESRVSLVQSGLQNQSDAAAKRPSPRNTRQLTIPLRHFMPREIGIAIGKLSLLECSPFVQRELLCDEIAQHAKGAIFKGIRRVSTETFATRSSRRRQLRVSDLWGTSSSLAELYAQSRAARSSGLRADDFDRQGAGGCDLCRGSGVNRVELDLLGQLTQPCRRCGGSGFDAKVSEIVVAGNTIAEASTLTIAALRATLPLDRATMDKLAIAEQLSLGALPLDRLYSEIAESERALLILAAALASGARRGRLLLLDGLLDSLSRSQLQCAESACFSACRSGVSIVVLSVHELALEATHARVTAAAG